MRGSLTDVPSAPLSILPGEWPDKVTAEDHLHTYIDVWYHIGDFNDTEKRAGVGTGVGTGAVGLA